MIEVVEDCRFPGFEKKPNQKTAAFLCKITISEAFLMLLGIGQL